MEINSRFIKVNVIIERDLDDISDDEEMRKLFKPIGERLAEKRINPLRIESYNPFPDETGNLIYTQVTMFSGSYFLIDMMVGDFENILQQWS